MIACYRLVSTLRKRVTKVACQTSELLDTQGKQRADAAFGLNDPPRAWIGLQLATPPQDPHVGAAVVRADARLITPDASREPVPIGWSSMRPTSCCPRSGTDLPYSLKERLIFGLRRGEIVQKKWPSLIAA